MSVTPSRALVGEPGRDSGVTPAQLRAARAAGKALADMKNSASREGGSITAACFLERFVEEGVKWAHLDIAGVVWSDKANHLHDKGATGFGVAVLDRYIADNHEG